jgi:hypothetical protein
METQQREQQNIILKKYSFLIFLNIFVLAKDFIDAFLFNFTKIPKILAFNPLPPITDYSSNFSLQNIPFFNFDSFISFKGFEYLDFSKIYSLSIPLITIFIFSILLSFFLVKKSIDAFLQKKIILTVCLTGVYIYIFIYVNMIKTLLSLFF